MFQLQFLILSKRQKLLLQVTLPKISDTENIVHHCVQECKIMNDQLRNSRPIAVFDSGVGGLTVLKSLRARLPGEDLLYLGDTARLPYGTKSERSIHRYANQAARHLSGRNIKLLVVACNTVSAVALLELKKSLAPVPVIGVIEPGARAAGGTRSCSRKRAFHTPSPRSVPR